MLKEDKECCSSLIEGETIFKYDELIINVSFNTRQEHTKFTLFKTFFQIIGVSCMRTGLKGLFEILRR